MTDLYALRDMLDAATGPSLELDQCIDDYLSPIMLYETVLAGGRSWRIARKYSYSIDAALALVERLLPVSWIRIERLTLTRWQVRFEGSEEVYWTNAPTAPLAILRALVAALIAVKEADHG